MNLQRCDETVVAGSARTKRCVVADDLPSERGKIDRWMSESGFRCTLACCGATALHAIRQVRPDVVIADMEMPHSSGLDLLYRVRSDPDPEICRLPVIISSRAPESDASSVADHLGRSVIIHQPTQKKELLTAVERFAADEQMVVANRL